MIRSYKILRHASALLSAAAMLWSVSAARADDLPPELRVIVTPDLPADPTQTADNNLLALNSAMFDLYGASGAIFQANFLAHHPVILALFSGAGGHFILYRPGQPPLDAPPVPIVYQLMKSVGHSTMALAEVVMPYIESPKNQAWRASLLAYRSRMQSALDSVNATYMEEDWKANNVSILKNNILFSVLAQFFPPDAINDRLMLIETISFTTTPEDMLDSLTRIIADRPVGAAFFGSDHLMDYELKGGDARQAIIDEDMKRGITQNLPPLVPFGSHQWPTLVTPGPGPKSLADLP